MRTNKTAVILIVLLLIFAFASVFIVLYDINNKNKEDIILSLTKTNSQYIIDASNFELLSNTFNSTSFDEFISKNIKNYEIIRSNISKIQSDSVFYSRIMSSRSLLATYNDGDWILLIKTNSNIKPNIEGHKGHFGSYHYISSSKFERNFINTVNNSSITHVINSRANTSDLHIIEAIKSDEEIAWIGHDLYFNNQNIDILSFYSPAKKLNNDISKNNSTLIQAFAKNKKSYNYTFQNNNAVSVLKASYSSNLIVDNSIEIVNGAPAQEEEISENTNNNETFVSPLPETNPNIDPLALYSSNNKIISGPFYVNNHTNQQGNIIIQDSDNIVYFLTTTGTVKWRFNLDSKIIGDITEMDSYNNNKIQYLFNTTSRMYLLTILGDNVKGFPLKLPVHAQNQILLDFTNIDNFNLLYAGIDNNAYILKYNKGDLRLHTKIENIYPTEKMFDVVFTGKNKHFVINRNDNSHIFYTFTGSLYFTVDKSYSSGKNPSFFENKTNSKGSYVVNDNQGRLSYISRNKETEYTEFGKFDKENYFEYLDITGNGDSDFIFIDKNKISAYDKFKSLIFNSEIKFTSIDYVKFKTYKNIVKIIVYSEKDSKAMIFNYNRQTKKLSKDTYKATTRPDVTFSNSLIIETNHLYLK
ncbi:MAG: hypothetical protein LBP67_04495 [Bacteroidales bacterium]|jgi:hypothetical protein|nr:hypothetical protein [Bacteroidales bacterium]